MERPAGAEEKAWGWAQSLWQQTYQKADGSVAVQCRGVRVFIRAGGFSSIHKHRHCSNIFSVTKGRLRLRDYIASEYADVPPVFSAQSTLEEGDHPLTFPPECLHQFEALTDVLALEVYIAGPEGDASAADIVRFSENGCKQQSPNMVLGGVPLMVAEDSDRLTLSREVDGIRIVTRNEWGPEYGKPGETPPKLYGADYRISPDMSNAEVAFGSMESYAHIPVRIVPESVRVDEDGNITATVAKEDGELLRKAFADEGNCQEGKK